MTERIHRLSTLIKIIANNPGITLTQVHKRLPEFEIEITERTLAKDIASLKHEYQLLPETERLRKGYVLEDIVTLSRSELELVLDALQVLSVRMSDPEAEVVMTRLMTLINRSTTDKAYVQTRTVRQRNILNKQADERDKHKLLQNAIRQSRAVSMTYNTPRVGKDEQIVAFPLLMVFHERGWYCIMRDLNETNYRPRRLDRITKCRLAQEAIVNPTASDNLKEANYLLSCGWGMSFPLNTRELKVSDGQPPIVVRFDRTMAPFIMEAVERHPRATISRVKDGTASVDFSICLSQPMEFIQWVRSFGAKAIILSPSNIVEQEKAEIRRVLDRYTSTQ